MKVSGAALGPCPLLDPRRFSMIQLDGIEKGFGGRAVLRDVSFHVGRGEIVGLLGPNGSGKTTSIRLVNGVLRPDRGAITVDGKDPSRDGDEIRRGSGILTETAALYPHMTALENLRFYARIYGVREPGRAEALLEEFGLAAHRDVKAGVFSTGMKKRLGIAKALLHRPRLLFLDEPTNGLDPEGMRQVLGQIRELNRRDCTTMILCSHLLQQMETVCHRYVFLDGGKVIEQGTLEELEARHRGDVRVRLETDLAWEGESFEGYPVRRLGPREAEMTLPGKEAIPDLLRRVTRSASLWGAVPCDQDLESLYFRIRGKAVHEP